MVRYLKEKNKCRRKMLLEKFDVDVSKLPSNEHTQQCCLSVNKYAKVTVILVTLLF